LPGCSDTKGAKAMNNLILSASGMFVAAVASLPLTAQINSSSPLEVVPSIDLSRYVGTWYEIARLPNGFQKKCAGNVIATYTLMDDGTIKVVNRCRKEDGTTTEAEGKAKVSDESGPNTKLKVRFAPAILSFLPFVWGDYWIIELGAGYEYAVVGEPKREYMWILSRTPTMDEGLIQNILARTGEKGFDVSKVIRTAQDK